jgi:hypothetical protein
METDNSHNENNETDYLSKINPNSNSQRLRQWNYL